MRSLVATTLIALLVGLPLMACSSAKKKKGGGKSMFGYPYKSRNQQVKDAFGG